MNEFQITKHKFQIQMPEIQNIKTILVFKYLRLFIPPAQIFHFKK